MLSSATAAAVSPLIEERLILMVKWRGREYTVRVCGIGVSKMVLVVIGDFFTVTNTGSVFLRRTRAQNSPKKKKKRKKEKMKKKKKKENRVSGRKKRVNKSIRPTAEEAKYEILEQQGFCNCKCAFDLHHSPSIQHIQTP